MGLRNWGGKEIRKKVVVETEIQTGRDFKRMLGVFIDNKVKGRRGLFTLDGSMKGDHEREI